MAPAIADAGHNYDWYNPIFANNKFWNRADYKLCAGNARFEPHSYVLMDNYEGCLGIAMTRSIGDVEYHKFGLTCEPEHRTIKIDNKLNYIFLCTDGVWDCWDNATFAKFVTNGDPDINAVVSRIMKESNAFAIKNFGRNYDDSAIIGCLIKF
jgi:serine/threonine protein phosphatase PrpC